MIRQVAQRGGLQPKVEERRIERLLLEVKMESASACRGNLGPGSVTPRLQACKTQHLGGMFGVVLNLPRSIVKTWS